MKLLFVGLLSSAMLLSGCADPSGPLAPKVSPSELFASIVIDVESGIFAVGDSIDFKATALSISKDTIPLIGRSLEWGVSDPSKIRIDQNGRVHFLKSSDDAIVYPWVRWTYNGVTRADSAYLVITQNRPPVASIKIRQSGDSARVSTDAAGNCCAFSVIAVDAAGDSLVPIRAPVWSNPRVAESELNIGYYGALGIRLGFGQYSVMSKVIGPFWLKTETLVYGTLMRDSIKLMGLYPLGGRVTISPDPITAEISTTSIGYSHKGYSHIVQPCGSIEFSNRMTQPIEVVFDEPEKVSGCVPGDAIGNIDSVARNAIISRKIPSGTVRWTARVKGSGPLAPAVSGTVTTREP